MARVLLVALPLPSWERPAPVGPTWLLHSRRGRRNRPPPSPLLRLARRAKGVRPGVPRGFLPLPPLLPLLPRGRSLGGVRGLVAGRPFPPSRGRRRRTRGVSPGGRLLRPSSYAFPWGARRASGSFCPRLVPSCRRTAACPVAAARKVVEEAPITMGWAPVRVEILKGRPMQCFRCLQAGHAAGQCQDPVDRSGRCHRCGSHAHSLKECGEMQPKCPQCADLGV